MVEDINFNVIDNDGNIRNYIILDKFSKKNKNYVIYKEKNNDELYASLYEIKNDTVRLIPIEKDEDYDIVDDYLENL